MSSIGGITVGDILVSLIEVGPASIPWEEICVGDRCWIKCIRNVEDERQMIVNRECVVVEKSDEYLMVNYIVPIHKDNWRHFSKKYDYNVDVFLRYSS